MTERQLQLKRERRAYDDGYFDTRYKNIHWHLEKLRGALPRGGKAVDLGSGCGAGTINLAIRGFSVVAIDSDISRTRLAYALQKSVLYGIKNVKYVVGREETELSYPKESGTLFVRGKIEFDLGLPTESADLVTFFHTWPSNLDKEWQEIYSEGARVLKNKGLFVATVDRESSVLSTEKLLTLAGLKEISTFETPNITDNHLDLADKYLITARKLIT